MAIPFGSRPHAELGASSAHRWMGCPGSVRLAATVQAPSSTYAEEGTAAHMVAERCLSGGLAAAALIGQELNGHIVDADMADHVQVYLDAVRAEVGADDVLLVEQRFSLERLDPPAEMFGTADAVVYKPALRRLVVFDLKYGAGVPVEAAGNPQARYYALGACLALDHLVVSEVEVVIVQPRCTHPAGPVRRETVPAFELLEWSADLLEAAERTLEPDAPLVAGDWCRFCPAAGVCPALSERALTTAQIEFAETPVPSPPDPASLAPDEIGRLLSAAELVELWIRALRGHACAELEAGRAIPGWKLVPKRATRRWRDEDAAPARLRDLGLAEDELFARKLRSPAQVEKLLGAKRKREIAVLVVAESGGATLAPEADPRPPITTGTTADFAALPAPVSS
jgi:hypothetical protein